MVRKLAEKCPSGMGVESGQNGKFKLHAAYVVETSLRFPDDTVELIYCFSRKRESVLEKAKTEAAPKV